VKRAGLIAALLLVGGAAVGCSTAPTKPRPTPEDVYRFKHETSILGSKAILNAPWSHEQIATIAEETSAIQHHFDQLAEAAGIGTPAK
jgi:hypothetical protein